MIKKFENQKQLDEIMKIWLNTNIEAHKFIPEAYWVKNYNFVRQVLPNARVLIYEENQRIKGFIGIIERNYIAGLFILKKYQSNGIGSQLIKRCQQDYDVLKLNVFSKNQKAINFYKKHNFMIEKKSKNSNTGEQELLMIWQK